MLILSYYGFLFFLIGMFELASDQDVEFTYTDVKSLLVSVSLIYYRHFSRQITDKYFKSVPNNLLRVNKGRT